MVEFFKLFLSDLISNQKFTDLNVWKHARQLKLEVYELVKGFPKEEKYELANQIIRCVRSIAANIAEGHGSFTYKDQVHFCIQARGSLSETLNHLIDAFDCGYINSDTLKRFEEQITSVAKLLNGYITFLRNAASQQPKQ